MIVFETLAVQVATKASATLVTRMLTSVLERQQETAALLTDMKRDLAALLHGPLHTGLAYVAEAVAAGDRLAEREESLRLARQEFMRALGQEQDHLLRADAALNLALVLLALGRQDDASRYALDAAGEAGEALGLIVEEENRFQAKGAIWLGGLHTRRARRKRLPEAVGRCTEIADRLNDASGVARALGARAPFPHAYVRYTEQRWPGVLGDGSPVPAKIHFRIVDGRNQG